MIRQIYCAGCETEVAAELTDGSQIYPHRPDLASQPFWQCPTCNNYVGCHHKTKDRTRPLGCIPTERMRRDRSRLHRLIDPIWRKGLATRKEVYRRMSLSFNKNFHSAELSSEEETRYALELARRLNKEYKL